MKIYFNYMTYYTSMASIDYYPVEFSSVQFIQSSLSSIPITFHFIHMLFLVLSYCNSHLLITNSYTHIFIII